MSDTSAADLDLNHSVRLNTALELGPEYQAVVSAMADEIIATSTIRLQQGTKPKLERALRIVLANLIRAYNKHPQCFVAVSLNSRDYSENTYLPNAVGYRSIKRAIDYLVETAAYVEFVPGNYLIGAGRRYTSRIRAKAALWQRLSGSAGRLLTATADQAIPNPTIPSIFSLQHNEASFQPIRRKNAQKLREEYPETDETRGMRERLTEWNRFLEKHIVDIFLTDAQFDALFEDLTDDEFEELEQSLEGSDEDQAPKRLDLTSRPLYRVFNNSSFEQGGRFYGGWWQSVPSKRRRFITINDIPTRELDYSSMLPNMLYAMQGLQLEGDAYAIPGIEGYRKQIKKVFLQLINARPGRRIRPLRHSERPAGFSWQQLQDAIRGRHQPIARYFNSGIGLRLQKYDSDIADLIMMSMMRQNVLVLPIHDSFIVHRWRYDDLKREMLKAYREVMGTSISVDVDPSFADFLHDGEAIDPHSIEDQFIIEAWESRRQDAPEYTGYFGRLRHFISRYSPEWATRFDGGET